MTTATDRWTEPASDKVRLSRQQIAVLTDFGSGQSPESCDMREVIRQVPCDVLVQIAQDICTFLEEYPPEPGIVNKVQNGLHTALNHITWRLKDGPNRYDVPVLDQTKYLRNLTIRHEDAPAF